MSNIVSLILAAGQSKRFGSPKQLLKWKDSNLLEHAIQSVCESKVSKTFLVLGANYAQILKEVKTNHVEIVRNETWEKGLGNSIAFGVNHILKSNANIDGILLMLADQPLIDSEYLDSLINKFESDEEQIIASSYKNGKKGVPALFDKCYFKKLSNLKGDKGAKNLIGKYDKKVITLSAEQIIFDIDTKEDYKSLYQKHHQQIN